MKNLALKILLIIPVLFVVDYMVMIMVGSISYLFGFTYDFATVGKIVILISVVMFVLALVPDVKTIIKELKLS